MALLNYSTTIGVDKTVGEIVGQLATHGARSIKLDYDDEGNTAAVAFLVKTQFGERGFRLPANIDAVWKVMTRQYEAGKVARRFATREQAARVGWRIVLDWVKAQMAIIETEMVSMDQVFLPYMTERGGKTLYEVMIEQRLALPAGSER